MEKMKHQIYGSLRLNDPQSSQVSINNVHTHTHIISLNRLLQHIELLQWRKLHQTHLIAVKWTKIEPLHDKAVTITIKDTITLTPLPQILTFGGVNLFKKISKLFVGFKILFQKFGPFELQPQMIAFDQSFEPFVWMNKDYAKNEYKRDFVSQEEFAKNILMMLIRSKDKIGYSNFEEQCNKFKGNKYGLNDMVMNFVSLQQEVKEQIQGLQTASGSKCEGLTFNKTKAKRKTFRRKNGRESSIVNQSFDFSCSNRFNPEIKTSHALRKQSEDLQTDGSLPTSSSLPPFEKGVDKMMELSAFPQLDRSFDFQQYDSSRKTVGEGISQMTNTLFVSVNLSQESQQVAKKEIIVLPFLDKYSKCVVNSIISSK